jgi:uncharacterized tellurite resistance protein B-like protein
LPGAAARVERARQGSRDALFWAAMRVLRELLGLPDRADERVPHTVRRIAAELAGIDAQRARYLAAFAYVLARLARADLEIAPAEREQMTARVREHSSLEPHQAELVVELASALQVERGGTENYVVTRLFRELAGREQRIELLECLFAVAAADRSISELESAELVKIGGELGFAREEVAALRSRFRAHLEVLRAPGGTR